MLTPAELREASRRYRAASTHKPTPTLKLYLARHSLALAQLAEQLERARRPSPHRPDSGGA